MNATVIYKPTSNLYIWEVIITSDVLEVYNHSGYVFGDEAGLFSKEIYATEEDACDALNIYVNRNLYANSNIL